MLFRSVVKPILRDGMGIDERVHDLAIVVFPMRSVGEIEVSAIVAKTIIIGIGVLPSPVLRGQLAIPRVSAEMFSPSSSCKVFGKRVVA